MDVELRLRLNDQASRGFAAFEQRVRQVQQRLRDEVQRTAQFESQLHSQTASASVRAYERIQSARSTLGIRSETAIRREIQQTEAAYNRLARSGAASAAELARAQQASIDRIRTLRNEMGELTRMQRTGVWAQNTLPLVAGGYVALSSTEKYIRPAADLEEAQSQLKIAMMQKDGSIPASYTEIMRQAVELGNKLPGSTKDYAMAATALKEQAMPDSAIAGGGLKAAAYFGVLMGMDQYQSATTIAKMRTSYRLKDNELPEMANLMQQARYAYGIHPDDFRYVAQYAAPAYNMLGLNGIDNAKKLLALQGEAASVGLDGSVFGTSFSMIR